MNLENLQSRYESKRLLLRPFVRADRCAYCAYHSRADVYQHLLTAPPNELELQDKFERVLKAKFEKPGDIYRLAVIAKSEQIAIGEVMIELIDQTSLQGEVGYVFNPAFGGQGFATEAMSEMLHIGFEKLQFHRLFARLDTTNRASVSLLERLGLRREAHLVQAHLFNGKWIDEYVYAMLRNEWRARNA